MKMLSLTTRDVNFKKDFNWNQTRVQDGKWPLKLSRLEILEQGSILGCRYYKIFEPKPQGLIFRSSRTILTKRRIFEEYSFKNRSFKEKNYHFISITIFFQDSQDLRTSIFLLRILQGSIFQRQTALYQPKRNFSKMKKAKK